MPQSGPVPAVTIFSWQTSRSPSTSAAPRWPPGSSPSTAPCWNGRCGRPRRRRARTTPRCCGTPWPDWSRASTALVGAGDRLVVCGTGCGGPMSPGGEEVSPLNIAGWRSFPLRSRLAALDRAADLRRQRRQGAGARRGVGRRGGRLRRLHRHGRVDGRRAAASCSTAGCSTGGSATRATSATSSSSPTVAPVSAAAAAVSRRRRRARRWPPSPGQPARLAPPEWVERTGTLVGRAIAVGGGSCSTCRSPS